MEYALEVQVHHSSMRLAGVLILVLMEYALEAVVTNEGQDNEGS